MEKALPMFEEVGAGGLRRGQSHGGEKGGSHVCSKDVWDKDFWKKKWDWIDNSPIAEIRAYVDSRMSKFKAPQLPLKGIMHSALG